MLDVNLRRVAEYESQNDTPVGASAGPEGTVIITYDDHVEVFANMLTASQTTPEAVAIFTKVKPNNNKKNKQMKALAFDKFTDEVMFHDLSNRFIGVTDEVNITSWPATHGSTLYDSSTLQLFDKGVARIHGVLHTHALPKYIVVLDHYGHPYLVPVPTMNNTNTSNPAYQRVTKLDDTPDVTIVHYNIMHVQTSTCLSMPVLVQVVKDNLTKVVRLVTYALLGENNQPNITLLSAYVLPAPEDAAENKSTTQKKDIDLKYACIETHYKNTKQYSIGLLWNNNTVQVLSVTIQSTITASATLPYTATLTKQFSSAFTTNADSTCSMQFLSSKHMLITMSLSNNYESLGSYLPAIVPASPCAVMIIDTTYSTISGCGYMSAQNYIDLVLLESTSFSAPALLLTSTSMHLLNENLQPPSLASVIGFASRNAVFFTSLPIMSMPAVSSIAPGAVNAQLMTTPSPFLNNIFDKKETGLATLKQGTYNRHFVNSLIQGWSGIVEDADFCEYVQTQWQGFANNADELERNVLRKMFPAFAGILGASTEVAVEEPVVPKKKGSKRKTASVELEEPTPMEYLKLFFLHTSLVKNNKGVSAEEIANLHTVPHAWLSLSKNALLYTGRSRQIDVITQIPHCHSPISKIDVQFSQPLSPLFIALTARYCLHQLQCMLREKVTDDRILYTLPLRVLICSQSLSARLVPTLITTLLDLKQWGTLQDAVTVLSDLGESELIMMISRIFDNWATTKPSMLGLKTDMKVDYPTEQHRVMPSTSKGRKALKRSGKEAPLFTFDVLPTLSEFLRPIEMNPSIAKLLLLSSLRAKVSMSFLGDELHALPIAQVLIFLRYLVAWLQAMWLYGPASNRTRGKLFMSKNERAIAVKSLNALRRTQGLPEYSQNKAMTEVLKALSEKKAEKETKMVQNTYNMSSDQRRALRRQEQKGVAVEDNAINADMLKKKVVYNAFHMLRSSDTRLSAVAILCPHMNLRPMSELILNWIAALLDAHYVQILLLMNTDSFEDPASLGAQAFDVISKLQSVVKDSTGMARECRKLKPFLKHWSRLLTQDQALVPRPAVSTYSIQLMKL